MKYIIHNIKYGNYFNKKLKTGFHFVQDVNEAYVFKNKKEANSILKLFKAKENYELVVVKNERRSEK